MRVPGRAATPPQALTHRPRASGPHAFAVRGPHRSCARQSTAHGQARPATAGAPMHSTSTATRPAYRDDRETPLNPWAGMQTQIRDFRISVKQNFAAMKRRAFGLDGPGLKIIFCNPIAHSCPAFIHTVIASAAKRSRTASAEVVWIASSQGLLAMTRRSDYAPRRHSTSPHQSLYPAQPT